MKIKIDFKDVLKRTLCLALMLTIAISFSRPITVEAKAKTVSVKKCTFKPNMKPSAANKKATTVKKGSYHVVMKNKDQNNWYEGFLKFTAPKTANYKITASGLKASDGDFINGFVSTIIVSPYSSDTLVYTLIKTSGGAQTGLEIASETFDTALYSRTGKIKLKKGQVLYLYPTFLAHDTTQNCSFNLTIK